MEGLQLVYPHQSFGTKLLLTLTARYIKILEVEEGIVATRVSGWGTKKYWLWLRLLEYFTLTRS